MDVFKDPTDGALDMSRWLLDKRGFLPVPVLVTEPAVGYGGGAGLLFFHKSKADAEVPEGEPLGLPPSISAVFGMGTANGTWAAGGGHFGSWREDSIRYVGGVGYSSMNLDFYLGDRPFEFELEGVFLHQDLQFRLWRSDFFAGGRYQFLHAKWAFESPLGLLSEGISLSRTFETAGLGPVVRYDSRDNLFTPSRGQEVELAAGFFGPGVGGDDTFQKLEVEILSYHTLHPRLVLGLRLAGDFAWGEIPFYSLPYVKLRGIPALRYQDVRAGVGEIEARWNVYKRWSLIGFVGVGWTDGRRSKLFDQDAVVAGGGGIRYLVARQLGLHGGVDVARGPEETVIYFQTGGAW
jgi:hypothetical protein